MSITLTRTPGAYLAAALEQPRPAGRPEPAAHPAPATPAVPALDSRGTHLWPRRIAARLGVPLAAPGEAPQATPVPDDAVHALRDARDEHLVVSLTTGEDGDFAYPAAVFALARHARLLLARDEDDLLRELLARRPRYLTLVGHTWCLDFALTARIRARHPTVELGLLCAHTVTRLSELVLKTLLYPHAPAPRDVLLAPLVKGSEPLHNGRLTIHPQDSVDAAALARPSAGVPGDAHAEAAAGAEGNVPPGPAGRPSPPSPPNPPGGEEGAEPAPLHRLFSVITHGSEDYLRLTSRDILCGLTPDPAEQAAAVRESATLPACMRGDVCVYPDAARWDPASVPAQIVFVNACLTLKLGTQLFGTGNRFTVAQRFLDAWAGTYIASPLLKDGTPAENLLFHYLLEEGHTVGGAVRQVNESLRRWGIDAPETLVIGDPEATYAPAPGTAGTGARAGTRATDETVTTQEEPGRTAITFEGRVPAYTRIRLKDPELRDAYRAEGLSLRAAAPFGGKLPLYGTLSETRDGELDALVFGFQDRPLTGTETARTLAVTRPREREADRIVRAVERYENLACLDIKLDKARSVLTDAANSLPAVARRTKTGIAELTQSEPLDKATRRLRANCARLDRHLLDSLLRLTETREYHFVEAYRPAYAVEHVESPFGTCGYCDEATHRYTSAHVLRPHLRRHLVSCPVCGATQDTEDTTVRLTVEGDATLAPDSETSLLVRIANDGTEELDVLLGARITRGKPHGFGFRLDPESLRVPPGATAGAHLTVTTGRPRNRHAMLLRCYAVGLGRIDFAGRDLRFR